MILPLSDFGVKLLELTPTALKTKALASSKVGHTQKERKAAIDILGQFKPEEILKPENLSCSKHLVYVIFTIQKNQKKSFLAFGNVFLTKHFA